MPYWVQHFEIWFLFSDHKTLLYIFITIFINSLQFWHHSSIKSDLPLINSLGMNLSCTLHFVKICTPFLIFNFWGFISHTTLTDNSELVRSLYWSGQDQIIRPYNQVILKNNTSPWNLGRFLAMSCNNKLKKVYIFSRVKLKFSFALICNFIYSSSGMIFKRRVVDQGNQPVHSLLI